MKLESMLKLKETQNMIGLLEISYRKYLYVGDPRDLVDFASNLIEVNDEYTDGRYVYREVEKQDTVNMKLVNENDIDDRTKEKRLEDKLKRLGDKFEQGEQRMKKTLKENEALKERIKTLEIFAPDRDY